jgi:hypothetical protein
MRATIGRVTNLELKVVDGFTVLILLALVMSAVVLERRAGDLR